MNSLLEHPPMRTGTIAPSRLKRLLLVAYNFPPVGGAGVQRPVKWVKNLRRFGWDVTVLTTENPSVPARDESLLADIPEDVLVVRARTWEPDYRAKQKLASSSAAARPGLFGRATSAVKGLIKRAAKLMLQPDPQVLWVPNAIKAGQQVLREFKHDVILVTAPAYSSFFIGTSLKRQFGLPLVLDFRDEWDMSGKYLENAQRDLCSLAIQERMQRHVLKRADAVVATTQASTANLAEKLSRLNRSETPAVTVYNGFDVEDFAAPSPHAKPSPSAKCDDVCCSESADNVIPLSLSSRPPAKLCKGFETEHEFREGEAALPTNGVRPLPTGDNSDTLRSGEGVRPRLWAKPGEAPAEPGSRDTHRLGGSSGASPSLAKDQSRFRLLYTGTLWNLTTIEPLVDAVMRLHETSPEFVARLELVCVGRKTPEQIAVLNRLKKSGCQLELIDYCEHSKILDWLRSANAVCLLLSDVPGAERVVPAKLFEYLANRQDMLSIVPQGETADIVQRFFPQGWYEPRNIDGIATWLRTRLSGDASREPSVPPAADINEYSRTTQTKRLVELLDSLVREPLRGRRSGTK